METWMVAMDGEQQCTPMPGQIQSFDFIRNVFSNRDMKMHYKLDYQFL